ncbi:hypothetical protein ABG768_008314 [Culter alburnus]|uniref:Uncharacterized protein n=1 Tax=Culter alburnus TaxID=194366 RepID=A0AAW1ZG57_CULAL
MEKEKVKGKGLYREKLNNTAKQRYLEKLLDINTIDPYDLPVTEWTKNPEALPPLTYPDIVNYLVYGISAYTMQQFRSFKSLEAYQQFCCGWVQDLQTHKPVNCESSVILAKVALHFY